MTDKATAAQTIRRLAVFLQDINEAADALEAMGSVEQAISEANAQRGAAIAERDAIRTEVEFGQSAVAKAQAEVETALDGCRLQIAQLHADAKTDTENRLQDARAAAEAIIASGQNAAQQAQAQADRKLQSLTAQIDELATQLTDAEMRRNDAVTAADEAQARLQNVQDQIQKLANA